MKKLLIRKRLPKPAQDGQPSYKILRQPNFAIPMLNPVAIGHLVAGTFCIGLRGNTVFYVGKATMRGSTRYIEAVNPLIGSVAYSIPDALCFPFDIPAEFAAKRKFVAPIPREGETHADVERALEKVKNTKKLILKRGGSDGQEE